MQYGHQQPDDDFVSNGVLGRRMFAWIIDAAVIGVIAFGLAILIWMIGFATLGLGFGLLSVLPFVPSQKMRRSSTASCTLRARVTW